MSRDDFPLDVLQRAQLIANRVRCHANRDPIAEERIIAEGLMEDRAALRGVSDEPGAGSDPIELARAKATLSDLLSLSGDEWIQLKHHYPEVIERAKRAFAAPDPAMPDTQSREGDQP